MNVSLNSFKVKPLPGVTEVEKLRKENAMLRQMVDAGMLSSHPGGLARRIKPTKVEKMKKSEGWDD